MSIQYGGGFDSSQVVSMLKANRAKWACRACSGGLMYGHIWPICGPYVVHIWPYVVHVWSDITMYGSCGPQMVHRWSKNQDQMLPPNLFIDVFDTPLPNPRATPPVAHINEKIKTGCSPWPFLAQIWLTYDQKWQKISHI